VHLTGHAQPRPVLLGWKSKENVQASKPKVEFTVTIIGPSGSLLQELLPQLTLTLTGRAFPQKQVADCIPLSRSAKVTPH